MHRTDEKNPRAFGGPGISHNNIHLQEHFAQTASIRRRFGTGVPGYEAAKSAWLLANPNPSPDEYTAAMRRIARAVRV